MTEQERRARIAQNHVELMEKEFPNEIKVSIDNTIIYGIKNFPTREEESKSANNTIYLIDIDSVGCLDKIVNKDKIAILNFASYKYPGGGFIKGQMAQEEALCHQSTLYPCISVFEDDYYAINRTCLNRGLYSNRALYTPNVVFTKRDGLSIANVITCAAPNYRVAHTYQRVSLQENQRVFRDRINFVLSIAESNGIRNLILGAWGCGVFMQSPYNTCEMIIQELGKNNYNIPTIYFAIPNSHSRNYLEFEKCLHTYNKTYDGLTIHFCPPKVKKKGQ